MTDTALVRAAALNNADWCAAVCRSHGIASRLTEDCWLADSDPPPFYPRVVSLTADPDRLTRAILDHRRGASEAWAVKDSFDVLASTATREKLFDAYWYVRPPGARAVTPSQAARVTNAAELDRWIAAWGETPSDEPVFVPDILAEPGVSFWHDGAFRAGLAAYRSDRTADIIGITNFFGESDARNSCIAWLIAKNPGDAIVGYGSVEEAASLAGLGFQAVAPLTIWLVRD